MNVHFYVWCEGCKKAGEVKEEMVVVEKEEEEEKQQQQQ